MYLSKKYLYSKYLSETIREEAMPPKKKKLCFVLMPFKKELKEVYTKAIQPACELAGFKSLRVDELKGAFNINRKIIEFIFKSDAIVADLSGWNPNVYYEMGVAHAIDNKTIMITHENDRLPFDVSTYNCIKYKQTEDGFEKLTKNITEFLLCIDDWRKHATNPVQDFKPFDALVPASKINELKSQIKEKENLLAQSVSKSDFVNKEKELKITLEELNSDEKKIISLNENINRLQSELEKKDQKINQLQIKIDEADKKPHQTKRSSLPPKTWFTSRQVNF